MYYYLAIVKKTDMRKGNIVPSYVLCKTKGTAESRAPWRVVQPDNTLGAMPKVLVTTLTGHEEMIDFLSCYRTRDTMYQTGRRKNKKMRKYYPEGGLFWFPCDISGYQTGPALFIKRVPDTDIGKVADQGFARLKAFWEKKPLMSEILTRDDHFYHLTSSNVKPKLRQ